ncbi:type II secretion system F family protein [Pantoea sp. 18069]|uniref:type II secretion system F family protein n=1 Tax=Pantoea sp. 18069 TaxID=2681415 RepID=UPI00135CC9AE|nr:type II secretion system F family protein [Pantoea sp. 18069]
MTEQQLWIASLALAALGVLLLAGALAWQLRRSARAEARVGEMLHVREASAAAMAPFPMPGAPALSASAGGDKAEAAMAQSVANSLRPPAWLQSGLSKALFASEDRKLMELAGLEVARGGLVYVISRVVLALSLPLLVLLLLQPKGLYALIFGFLAFGLGMMLPKWVVRSKANKRRQCVVDELPLFVDLLRLLQGVGLSIDQSMQILATEFTGVLRVIGNELALANRLYSSGRTREQSLQRLAYLGADDDLSAVVNLLVQVDKHGGAVQDPLKEFSLRLREKRQAGFKEKIGIITVKMTGVMVLTLLPALLVITAGPGFTAVIRSLSSMGGK